MISPCTRVIRYCISTYFIARECVLKGRNNGSMEMWWRRLGCVLLPPLGSDRVLINIQNAVFAITVVDNRRGWVEDIGRSWSFRAREYCSRLSEIMLAGYLHRFTFFSCRCDDTSANERSKNITIDNSWRYIW